MYVAGRAAQVAIKHGMDVSTSRISLEDIFKSNLDAEIVKKKNSKLGSGNSNSYLKQAYFDTAVFTPLQLDALVKSYIIMGTDYPFDMME